MTPEGVQSREEAISRIRSAVGDRLIDVRQPTAARLYIEVDPHSIPETTQFLSGQLGARFQTASAVDAPQKIEVLYHWALDGVGLVVTVRTRVDRNHPEMPSIAPLCPAAHWIEREMWELMGITFAGHPDLRHLLLQDDWPAGKFPLRRDYQRE